MERRTLSIPIFLNIFSAGFPFAVATLVAKYTTRGGREDHSAHQTDLDFLFIFDGIYRNGHYDAHFLSARPCH